MIGLVGYGDGHAVAAQDKDALVRRAQPAVCLRDRVAGGESLPQNVTGLCRLDVSIGILPQQ
jgi:hypothetical protein